jgi:1,2-diacylglycerol 3-alpha-glucosyltransferase
MRIAMLTDSFYPELGGIQDSIMTICRALGQQGHTVLLLAPSASRRDFQHAGLAPGEIDLGPAVRIERCPSIHVPGSTGQSRLALPSGRCRRALAAFAPDVIHVQTFFGLGLGARAAARRLGVPLIGTNHWAIGAFSDYSPLPAGWFRVLSERAVAAFYNRCDHVTAPSRVVLGTMQDAGLARPADVVSNPIDTDSFRPAPAADRQRLRQRFGLDGPTIIYAGRLAREKRIEVLIRALPEMRRRMPDTLLALAGHGSERARLERLAHAQGVGAHVRFLGTLSKRDLAAAFQAADLFAIASTSESQSMVLLQAMSAGLPVVAARAGALPEYVTPGCGLLAAPGNPADFADGIVRILADPEQHRQMGQRARADTARYATAAIARQWTALYARAGLTSPLTHDGVPHETEPDRPRL